jgi:AcrR family transcriptional regulator
MAGPEKTAPGRRYKGRTVEERRAERRAQLKAAALEVVGTRGWAEATMTEICRVAGLTERYFYESFASREELYGALIDDLDRELRAAAFDAIAAEDLAPAERLEKATRAVVALYVVDPRRGRAALIEGIGVQALEEQRRRTVAGLFGLVAERWEVFFPDAGVGAEERRLRATAIGGALVALISARLEGTLAIDDEALVRAVVATTTAIATAPTGG